MNNYTLKEIHYIGVNINSMNEKLKPVFNMLPIVFYKNMVLFIGTVNMQIAYENGAYADARSIPDTISASFETDKLVTDRIVWRRDVLL